MSAKSRCPDCQHPRGLRRSNLTRGGHECNANCVRPHKQTKAGEPRKSPCGCACHATEGDR